MASTNRQYKDSARFTFGSIIGIIILTLLMLLTSCYGTYVLTDSEYSDARETHASITYYNNQIYWGWHSGYYYYYGKPHYYPWYYYYNTCPPSHYHTSSHILITNKVNKPRPNWNKPTYKPGGNIKVKVNRTNVNRNNNVKTNVKTNVNRNKSNNSNKRSVKTRRNPK